LTTPFGWTCLSVDSSQAPNLRWFFVRVGNGTIEAKFFTREMPGHGRSGNEIRVSESATSGAERRKIGYVISRYPKISHTFIQREVLGLRAAGFDIETVAVVQAEASEILSPVDQVEADRTINLRPAGPGKILRHLVKPLLMHPLVVLGLLRVAGRGWWGDPRQLLWRVMYTIEAIMLWSLARASGISHLHAHHANVAANVAWLACEFGRRVGDAGPTSWTFTMHGSSEFVDVDRHDLGAKAEAAAAVACISDYTRSQLMMLSQPESWPTYSVVHCGVDPDVYFPADAGEADANTFTVLFVGRLGAEKGLPVLVEALGRLQEAISPTTVHFLVVGTGELQDEMNERCVAQGIRAEFVGAVGQQDILPYYQRADAFAMASFREGIPVVLMEAMACELACVAPRITAIPELIEDHVTGITVTAGRADHLAQALERYAVDPDFSKRVGQAARRKVLADFTTAGTIDAMADFFDSTFAEFEAASQ